jgi:hypothetical protein
LTGFSYQPTKIVLRRPLESAQYAAERYRDLLIVHGLVGSMGRRGNPYDNAKAESFMKTMKVEAVYPMAYETFEDVVENLPSGSVTATVARRGLPDMMADDDLVCPPPFPARDHPARRVALCAFHAQLSRRRRSAR